MTIEERQDYLGLPFDPNGDRKFYIRAMVSLIIISLATIVMFTEETRTIYKLGQRVSHHAKRARKAARRTKSLFEL
ncbi:hypothetical protein [Echinicola strongylocentroti]|uniref:hypothetical protein n=1 Tax=Echinicola strongylocentroti TaxID=1795355 RepID=UPI0013A68F4F|nr:hypothetical protein [Echinicola strongylocentroti]